MSQLASRRVLTCLAFGACSTQPTIVVTNQTGVPLKVVAYDYSAPTVPPGAPPGIYVSPEFTLGRVTSGPACLTFGEANLDDEFAVAGEDTTTGVDTPASATFVPRTADDWSVTFGSLSAKPVGPFPTSVNPC